MAEARPAAWYAEEECALDDFVALTARSTDPATCLRAAAIERNVPIYDCDTLRPVAADPAGRLSLMAEWAGILGSGPGVFVLARACRDLEAVDRATAIFQALIDRQRRTGEGGGDHFARPGANDRVWNALQKHCLADPEAFALYWANDMVAAACEAWLGPGYQMTAQVNLVNPGGESQQAHRDYHLGFLTVEQAARYQSHVHRLSPVLTLQGAIAHCDMPVESGPTKLLPFSQLYGPGYLAWRRPDFRERFEARCVQLPLARGDALFFNPALFHAAGENRTSDVARMANLLQVSSAFGRAMEAVDRPAVARALYPALQALTRDGRLDRRGRDNAIAAAAEGYAFPTSLDRDPPLGGLAPETEAGLMARALDEGWDPAAFETALAARCARRLPG